MAETSGAGNEAHPVVRLLAPVGAPASAGVAYAIGRPAWQSVALTAVYLVTYASWQFIDVWLVPVLRADSTRRARRMLGDDAGVRARGGGGG